MTFPARLTQKDLQGRGYAVWGSCYNSGMRFTLKQLLLSIGLIAIGMAPLSYVLSMSGRDFDSWVFGVMFFLSWFSGIFVGAGVAALAGKWGRFCFLFISISWVPLAFAVAFAVFV
jgi:hypothetical protein